MSFNRQADALTSSLVVLGLAACALPQQDGVFLLPAPYNYAFYDTHEAAARSFYAAHFTHFGAYEILMDWTTRPPPK